MGRTSNSMHTPRFTQPQLSDPWLLLKHTKHIPKVLLASEGLPLPWPTPSGLLQPFYAGHGGHLQSFESSVTWPLSTPILGFIITGLISFNQHECATGQGLRFCHTGERPGTGVALTRDTGSFYLSAPPSSACDFLSCGLMTQDGYCGSSHPVCIPGRRRKGRKDFLKDPIQELLLGSHWLHQPTGLLRQGRGCQGSRWRLHMSRVYAQVF